MRARLRELRRSRARDEHGYAAVMVALFVSTVLVGLLAIALDTGMWYVEREDAQKAADAAALAGVPYLPQDMESARTRAYEVAAVNGFCAPALPSSQCPSGAVPATVAVTGTDRATELRVSIRSAQTNQFGQILGIGKAEITQEATADYQGSAPMGSPCNTFGNEPSAGSGTSSPTPRGTSARPSGLANCTSAPQLWAGIQGVNTNKQNGDRYMNRFCNAVSAIDHCQNTTLNSEYGTTSGRPGKYGYFWLVRVLKGAEKRPISLQLYDPAYVNSGGIACNGLPSASNLLDNMNPYVTTDGKARYSSGAADLSATGAPFCNGDARAAQNGGSSHGFTTSFALRAPTDTRNPLKGRVMQTEGCVRQFRPVTTAPTVNNLRQGTSSYDDHLVRGFHNWVQMCSFTPPEPGDYYLQVRTNVSFVNSAALGGQTNSRTALIGSGNSTVWGEPNTEIGDGNNTFGIRAVPQRVEDRALVSVSGFERMPMFVNSANQAETPTEFNLIQVPPGSAGRYISFHFFDVADADGEEGQVQILLPDDAQVPAAVRADPFPGSGCRSYGGNAGAGTFSKACTFTVTNARNNGRVQSIDIPIHPAYACNHTSNAGCWFKVQVRLKGQVRDFTTWNATIEGDPVRLVN